MIFKWPIKTKAAPSPATDAETETTVAVHRGDAIEKATSAPPADALVPLTPLELRRVVDAKSLGFKTTADLAPAGGLIGQDRALRAIEFGMSIRAQGFNLFVMGPPGSGKSTAVRAHLERHASKEKAAADWVYVNNFEDAVRPRALKVPAGRAMALQRGISAAMDELAVTLPAAFIGEDYQMRRRAIEEENRAGHDDAIDVLTRKAAAQNIAVLRTPLGFALAPMHEGRVVKPEVFKQIPESMRREVEGRVASLQKELEAALLKVPKADKLRRKLLAELNEEAAKAAIEAALDEVSRDFSDVPEVGAYLAAAEQDLVRSGPALLPAGESGAGVSKSAFRRYLVNVVVAHGQSAGVPSIEESNPTLGNLVGRVEQASHHGATATDFLMIRPGALHRANGGFLVLDARTALRSPEAWEALKRALKDREIRIEQQPEAPGAGATKVLEPEPIALDLKVVLLGDRDTYFALRASDADFMRLFKVQADFDDTIKRTKENDDAFARIIAAVVLKHKTKPVDAQGVAKLIEESARLAEDSERLSIEVGRLADIVQEADYWAGIDKREVIGRRDIARAIDEHVQRGDRVRDRAQEVFERGIVLVDTEGAKPGQINGLSTVEAGDYAFGRPARITARVHLGQGRITDIEREVALGGPLHAKGVMILWGYLAGRFAQSYPLSLAATLVFEQSYSAVEGDSASAAELFALISALADVPIRQDLAVTGSVNQWGDVQAIDGVNQKVEGFFDVCQARGLTGKQGVIIPRANAQHLMLREDVVESVRDKWFSIYAVSRVDEGLEILTGLKAGEAGSDGQYPKDTINARVDARLRAYADNARSYASRRGEATS
ncbi:MAG: AAA family ATPase [Hyphomicrobium sp.]|jgi:lon-related putative ATP-dependent protease